MFLLSAVALLGSIVVAVLISYCCSMVRDISEAEEELRHRVLQFYRVPWTRRASRITTRS